MDRTWMYGKRNRMIYVNEVLNFVDVAKNMHRLGKRAIYVVLVLTTGTFCCTMSINSLSHSRLHG